MHLGGIASYSSRKVFERALAKLRPEISELEEYKILSKFLFQISDR